MKKAISFSLALLLTVSLCGCNSDKGTASSDTVETVYEEIVIDDTGSTVTSSTDTITSNTDSAISVDNNSSNSSSAQSSNTSSSQTVIDYDTTVEIDICDDIVRGYLNSSTAENQFFWLNEYQSSKLNYQSVSLDWRIDGSSVYTITVSENADFSNAYTLQTKLTTVKNAIFVPGKTYYWKVTGNITSEVLGGGKIHIKDAPVRWLYVAGVNNVRDMGGWKTENGKTVKYEMLYRGAQLNDITTSGMQTLSLLNIKTEFDIRSKENSPTPSATEGTGFNYVFMLTNAGYDKIFQSYAKEQVTSNYKKMFEYLSDSSNYPIYTHCQGGADRTGTYAFILNGLLGVSYEDLTRDFELTSFSGVKRWRGTGAAGTFSADDTIMQDDGGNYIAWGELYKKMMEYGSNNGCTTLQQSIEHWLLNYVGVPQAQIDSFKNIMLE